MSRYSVNLYGEADYWDKRYLEKKEESFDWYQPFSSLNPLFQKYISLSFRLLMVGCGNAALSFEMVMDGYENIVNIDISSVVIDAMKKKYENFNQLKYLVMDAKSLKFEDNSFDAIIDKGTLDSLMCGGNAVSNANAMLSESLRVLRPGGVYIMITYGDPSVRLPHLKKINWKVNVHVMPRPGVFNVPFDSIIPKILKNNEVDESGKVKHEFNCHDDDLHYIYICIKE